MDMEEKYKHHLKVYTDGSILEDGSAGSAFVIPSLKTEKSYHLGKGHSIFAAELVAILMALYCDSIASDCIQYSFLC